MKNKLMILLVFLSFFMIFTSCASTPEEREERRIERVEKRGGPSKIDKDPEREKSPYGTTYHPQGYRIGP
jgi:hypothetical protein